MHQTQTERKFQAVLIPTRFAVILPGTIKKEFDNGVAPLASGWKDCLAPSQQLLS